MPCSTSQARLTCLCGLINLPGTHLSSPRIPISNHLCHCNVCRRTSGTLGVSYHYLKEVPPRSTLVNCKTYKSSAIQTRYFCEKCGAKCFVEDVDEGNWFCAAGMIERGLEKGKEKEEEWPEDTIEVKRHIFVEDTVDGGITPLLLECDGRKIPAWKALPSSHTKGSETETGDIPPSEILSLVSSSSTHLSPPLENAYLKAECHCGSIPLLIKRANHPSPSSETNERHSAADPTRYKSYMCACRSCRLATGVSLVPWSLIPIDNIFLNTPHIVLDSSSCLSSDSPQPLPINFTSTGTFPSLAYFSSSPSVTRTFCSTCGCTVSYFSKERPMEVDIAIGILRAEEGSMARRWLDWEWGRCSFKEEMVDMGLLKAWEACGEVMGGVVGEGVTLSSKS